MKLNHLAVITPAMREAIAFFHDTMGLTVNGDENYAEVDAGGFIFSLMSSAVVPTERPQGVVLQFKVEDVTEATQRVRQRGGTILQEPAVMDWGTESAFVKGPDGLLIELYRWAQRS